MIPDLRNHHDSDDRGEHICSKVVRAGKRTYFIDVEATRGGDYYLTITESRKRIDRNGKATFTRNQIYLYKEDFAKFVDGLGEMVDYVKTNKPEYFTESDNEISTLDEEFDNL